MPADPGLVIRGGSGGGAPTGAAGGDLAGTYPNPTVKSAVALAGSPTTTTQSALDSSTKIATTAYADAAVAALKTRAQLQMEAQGYFAENFPRQGSVSAVLPTTSVIYYMALGLKAGDVVTNLNLMCNVLGSGFSGINMKVGLYTKAFARVAQSGDVSALFASAGPKVCPLSGPYTVPTSDGYFAAIMAIATTTPSMQRGTTGSISSGAFGSSQAAFGFQSGQTDLPTTATLTVNNNNSIPFWVGAS